MATIPTLNVLWRPNGADATKDDRELIRQYSEQPAVETVIHDLTVSMNRIATTSAAAVAQIQGWIDEVETLEAQWSGYVADGSSAQLNAPLRRADVLEWDTSGTKSQGGQAGIIAGRMAMLKGRILQAMNLQQPRHAQLIRS